MLGTAHSLEQGACKMRARVSLQVLPLEALGSLGNIYVKLPPIRRLLFGHENPTKYDGEENHGACPGRK